MDRRGKRRAFDTSRNGGQEDQLHSKTRGDGGATAKGAGGCRIARQSCPGWHRSVRFAHGWVFEGVVPKGASGAGGSVGEHRWWHHWGRPLFDFGRSRPRQRSDTDIAGGRKGLSVQFRSGTGRYCSASRPRRTLVMASARVDLLRWWSPAPQPACGSVLRCKAVNG